MRCMTVYFDHTDSDGRIDIHPLRAYYSGRPGSRKKSKAFVGRFVSVSTAVSDNRMILVQNIQRLSLQWKRFAEYWPLFLAIYAYDHVT